MLALLLAPLLASANGAAGASPLVVYPLQSKGVDPDAVRSIDASLRSQIASMDRFKLLGPGETGSVLRPPGGGLGLSCETGDDACLASVGRLLGGSVVAFGMLTPADAELWLVDAKTSAEVRRVQIRGSPLEAAREAAVALLTPDRYVGLLTVEGSSGRLAVDGVSRGDLPLPSPLVLDVGRHVVTLTIPGQRSWDVSADVRFGQTAVVSSEPGVPVRVEGGAAAETLAPVGPAPATARAGTASGSPLRTVAYVALAAGVLSLGAGIACGAISADNADALRAMQRPIPLSQFPEVNQAAARTQGFAIAADALFGAAVLFGAAGIVLYFVGGKGGADGSGAGVAVGGARVNLEANGVSIGF